MSEWQPARITPESNSELCQPGMPHLLDGRWDKAMGTIIRIRPIEIKLPRCFGRHFEIHPDDRVKIGAAESDLLCEHQIETD